MKSKINKKVIKNAIVALDDVISSESDSDLISPPTGVEEVNKVAETFRCCSNCLYSEVDDPEHVHADLCNIRSSTEVKRRFINKFCGLYEVTPEYRMLNTWGKHKNKNGDCPYYDPGAAATHDKPIDKLIVGVSRFFDEPMLVWFSSTLILLIIWIVQVILHFRTDTCVVTIFGSLTSQFLT